RGGAAAEEAPESRPAEGTDAPREPAPAAAPELREAAILFADISGFTRLSRGLDPEDVHDLLQQFFATTDGLIEEHGGNVDKHIGDGVMAVFGAPVAHGNDPERALRTALAIRSAMPELGRRLGHDLEVHIGVAGGRVLVGRDGDDMTVTGEAVNLAARLTELAGPGEILASATIGDALGEQLVGETRDAVSMRGFDEPVAYARVDDLAEPAAGGGQFVGRRAERQQLNGILQACAEDGQGMAVYIRGEAGIGKSRLLAELESMAAAAGFACYRGRVLDFGVGWGLGALNMLTSRLIGAQPADRDGVAAAAEKLVAEQALPQAERIGLHDLLDLPQPEELRAVHEAQDIMGRHRGQNRAIEHLVRGLGAEGPLLLEIEDIHWADEALLAQLAHLTTLVADHPVVLAITGRTDGDPLDRAWRAGIEGSPLVTIDLGPLRPAEALELAAAFPGTSAELAQACAERAAGHPLFLEQLLHAAGAVEQGAVPGSVQSTVLARVDGLAAADRQALQAASVLGPVFELEVLRQLIDQPGYDARELLREALVQPRGDRLLFGHALVRDAVYASLVRSRRRDLHRQAAECFAERDVELYAEHLERAGDPLACAAHLVAARVRVADHRYERALELAQGGLRLAGPAPVMYELNCLLGDVQRELGAIDASIDAFRTALQHAEGDQQRCRAWIGVAAGNRIVDRYDQALAALAEAEDLADEKEDPRLMAQISGLRGNVYFPLGRIDDCLNAHQRSREFARRAGSVADEAHALGGLTDAHYQRGHMLTAFEQVDACIKLADAHDLYRVRQDHLPMRAITQLFLARPHEALADAKMAAEEAAAIGNARGELLASNVAAMVHLYKGEWSESLEQTGRSLELCRRLGARRFESDNLGLVAITNYRLGRQQAAEAGIAEVFGNTPEADLLYGGPTLLGFWAVITEDRETRSWALREGEALLAKGCVSHCHIQFYEAAIEACHGEGDWDNMERHASALAAWSAGEPFPWAEFLVAAGRALATHGRDPSDQAAAAELARLSEGARANGFGRHVWRALQPKGS
ncbi:MAG: adenylate/guanylate cyclase domain-containing protein, partial [Alphaproteobacteria bacterium]|nr:adenylate/guanylate cyclase domain-containing protein [Alphaproteobacteria bacterium]